MPNQIHNCGMTLEEIMAETSPEISKKNNLKKYNEIVEKALREHPETRDDDNKLYVWVLRTVSPEVMNDPFGKTFYYATEKGLPYFETIRRTRQKIQHDNPSLRGKNYEKRQEKQNDYIRAFGRI